MTSYTTEETDKNRICFHFRVPPGELRERAGTSGMRTGAAVRTSMVRRTVDRLVSDACRKAAYKYPDIVYFKPAVTVVQNLPGRDLIFSASIQTQPACRLCDYRSVRLTQEDRTRAEESIQDIPEDEREATRLYLLQAALIGRIAEESTVEIPQAMVDERAASMAQEFKKRLEMGRESIDDYYRETGTDEQQMLAAFAADAERQLRTRLTLLAIAHEEGLEASEADYDKEIRRLGAYYPLPLEQIRALLEAGEGARLRQDIAVSKAADFISELVAKQSA